MEILLDVDRTIIAPGNKVNIALIRVLQQWGCERVDLVTSYSLRGNAADNAQKIALRIDAIRRLRRYGIAVRHVYISASPYYEAAPPQGTYAPGEYYANVIQPIEKVISEGDRAQNAVSAYLETHKETVAQEWETIHQHIGEERSETGSGQSTRGGKEHLLTHVLNILSSDKVPKPVVFFDDKPEVIYRSKAIAQDPWIEEQGLTLYPHRVDWHMGDDRVFTYETTLSEATKNPEGLIKAYLRAPIQPILILSCTTLLTLCFTEFAQERFLKQAKGHRVLLLNSTLEGVDVPALAVEEEGSPYWSVEGDKLHGVLAALRKQRDLLAEASVMETLIASQYATLLGNIEKRYGRGQPLQLLFIEARDTGLADAVAQDFNNDPSLAVFSVASAEALVTLEQGMKRHLQQYQMALARQLCHEGFYKEDKSEVQQQKERLLDLLEEGWKLYQTLDNVSVSQSEPHPQAEEASGLASLVSIFVEEIRCAEAAVPVESFYFNFALAIKEAFVERTSLMPSTSQKNASREKNEWQKEGQSFAILFEKVINRPCYESIHHSIIMPLLSYEDCSKEMEERKAEQILIHSLVENIMGAFADEMQNPDLALETNTPACKKAGDLLEETAMAVSQKTHPLKKRLRGFAGVALSLPTLGLAFQHEEYRDFFWHGRSKLESALVRKRRFISDSAIRRRPK